MPTPHRLPRTVIIAAATVAALCAAAGTHAGSRYLWVDPNGVEHFSRDAPSLGTVYTRIDVPDDVPWRNAPPQPGPVTADAPPSAEELYRQMSGSVYWVLAPARGGGTMQGSAVAISEDEALTNCHVVLGGLAPITLGDGASGESAEAEVVAADVEADRCVLRVRRLTLSPVRGMRAWDDVQIGEIAYAIGNPRALSRSLSSGLISGKREFATVRMLQTTTPISPGSSGGGLFDAYGNLLGITSSSLRGAQSVNFAIPASDYWR